MNNIVDIIRKLCELESLACNGIDVDDLKVESTMEALKDMHDQNIDSNTFLDEHQKKRRKRLYANAVREMKEYCKQSLKDETEIRRRMMNQNHNAIKYIQK